MNVYRITIGNPEPYSELDIFVLADDLEHAKFKCDREYPNNKIMRTELLCNLHLM